MQRIEYAALELARAAGLRVCRTRLERVGERDALMLDLFDREWNPDANAYWRYGLGVGSDVVDAKMATSVANAGHKRMNFGAGPLQ